MKFPAVPNKKCRVNRKTKSKNKDRSWGFVFAAVKQFKYIEKTKCDKYENYF